MKRGLVVLLFACALFNIPRSANAFSVRTSCPRSLGGLTVSRSRLRAASENESSADANNLMKSKVEGRKTRLYLGYYATSLVCGLYGVRYLGIRGNVPMMLLIQAASGYVLAGGLAYILASAVKGNRLNSDTYKRLNLSLLEFGLVGLFGWGLVKVGKDNVPSSNPLVLASLLASIHAIKGYGYGVLGVDKMNDASLVNDFGRGVVSTIKGYFSAANINSFVYLAATWMLTGLKLLKLTEIVRLMADGSSALMIYTRISRFARYAMMSTVLYTLKDAADRGRLEGSTFIELNFLSAAVLAAMALYQGINKPIGGAVAAISLFSAYNGTFSIWKKRKT